MAAAGKESPDCMCFKHKTCFLNRYISSSFLVPELERINPANMIRTRDLEYGVVGNHRASNPEMVEHAEKYTWLDIPDCMSLSPPAEIPPPTDPAGLIEMMDSFRAEIWDLSEFSKPEGCQGFHCLVEGNSDFKDMFFEWSMKYRDHIKFRQSNIECATRSLSYDIEGKKKLLKVLFEWVECCNSQASCYQNPNTNPSPSPDLGALSQIHSLNHQQFLTGIQTWDYSHVMDWARSNPVFGKHNPYVPNNGNMMNPKLQAVNGERSLGWLPAVVKSKDVRDKRMAIIHHRRNSGNSSEADHSTDGLQPAMGNWETLQLKVDLDCKFLLQKVLVKTDVGYNPGRGRIMLPKGEAESNLPALETGDRITFAMEEVGTSLVWSMYYRFLLDYVNRRKYILENTGEYVRDNRLRAGDTIELYLDKSAANMSIKDQQPAKKRKTWNASAAVGTSGNASSSHVSASKHH